MTPLDRIHCALRTARRGDRAQALEHVRLYREDGRGCKHLDRAATLIVISVDLDRQGFPDDAGPPLAEAASIINGHLFQRSHDLSQAVAMTATGPAS
jgi:hypothetical protein